MPEPQTQQNPQDTKPKPQADNTPKDPNLLYRAMQRWGNVPGIGESARLLGVRPNPPVDDKYDVRLNGDKVSDFDTVKNKSQGMSVAPATPLNLPDFRLTKGLGLVNRWGQVARGPDPIWEIPRTAITGKLVYIEDNPGGGLDAYHGNVAPAYCMKYDEYKQAIENTRPLWKLSNLTPYIKAR